MFAALVRFIQEWKRYNQSINELSRLGESSPTSASAAPIFRGLPGTPRTAKSETH